ncbi:glycoside hydrolase family 2 TIM barrel-domain containing protein [Pelagicoccus mobilis]|uniref:DUF4982 domain-containing protein n=1 Tax=Pelagicoccus mobilis TaxID=415221 RepID=A0A934RQW0_9BACT|nr:glycoside hydrolase family 2 TIM barrel-domain containing protein [Pelagicoccus mobilis]MBK1875875.1 DUF4982 domain-containing protein [Pelagicoccus mobilis]
MHWAIYLKQTLFYVLATISIITAGTSRETINLNDEWSFHLGDLDGAQAPSFTDDDWRVLSVPHDWAFEAAFRPNAAQTDRGGYKPGGIGWYRREIEMPESWKGKAIRIQFDGIYMDSQVWLNGEKLGGMPYGYLSFGFDIASKLKPGKNTLAIRVDNSKEPSARWYHGCGIYAPVNLVVTEPERIAHDGIYITTPEITDEEASVQIETEIDAPKTKGLTLVTRIISPEGKEVAQAKTRLDSATTTQTIRVPSPQRWDVDSPSLYTCVSQIVKGGKVRDTVETRFGIRQIAWETETGFWLNGRNLKLKGVADHLECGPVGAASPEAIIRWKLELLKSMGVNAVRTAHNPQVPAFYDICDEIGMLVMDEIFDGWRKKADQDYGARFFDQHWEADLRTWLKRDRNHPSIIIYSVGNETRGEVGADIVKVCHEVDPTRPVTSGHAAPDVMDVHGVNGGSERQRFYKKLELHHPFIATEAPHTWQVRGYYRSRTWWRDGYPNKKQDPFPLPDLTEKEIFTYDWAPASEKTSSKQVFNSSYDNAMVRISARKNWELMRDLPWYSGHFRWTGFDYLGEAGYVHGGWPFRAFMGGALDLAGFKKDLFYFYQSQWTNKPMVHLLPHWTHPKMEHGTLIPVWAYSNADEVELFLNGRSLGKNKPGTQALEMQCEWFVPWEPGTLEAVAYKDGVEVARAKHVTAETPARITGFKKSIQATNGEPEVAVVTVKQQDKNRNFYPYGENRIAFHLEGPAKILSLENGNPVDTEPNFGQSSRRAFFGALRAFVQPTQEKGDIVLRAGAILGERRQLTSDLVSINVRTVAIRGAKSENKLRIHYTTDGSTPTTESPRYKKPFPVSLGTTVKALVLNKGETLFTLEETFAENLGLHWYAPGEKTTVDASGLQAEDAKLSQNCKSDMVVSGHYGTGYAIVPPGDSVQFYQENDGSNGQYALRIRYQSSRETSIELKVNDYDVQTLEAKNTKAKWKQITSTGRILNGGNHIQIKNTGETDILLDELEVSSNF